MEYTKEQLKQIEELASTLTPIPEISVLMGLASEDMLAMAATAKELREKNLELAKACSPSAMEQCFRDIQEMTMSL